jgi:hypothetical protein
MTIERLKVFNNVVDASSTDVVTNVAIVTTAATEQAVINTLSFTAADPVYAVTVNVKQDDRTLITSSSGLGGSISDEFAGKQIVDVNSTFKLELDTGADKFPPEKSVSMLFNGSNNTYVIRDTFTEQRDSSEMTYEGVVDDLAIDEISIQLSATSAFGWLDGTNERFSRCNNNTVYTYDAEGTLLQTASAFGSSTYGACKDETYFYGKGTSDNLILERRFVSDGTAASDLALDTLTQGQAQNSGSFMLYYGGFIYIRNVSSVTVISKINVTTGAVTEISVNSSGSYSAGALITVARNGVAYLMECGNGANTGFIMNLSTDGISYPTHVDLTLSTEYGNLALEVAPGVALFFDGNDYIWLDANTMTGASSVYAISVIDASFPVISDGSPSSSIGSIPIHLRPASAIDRAVTYSLYVDGVDITGVV